MFMCEELFNLAIATNYVLPFLNTCTYIIRNRSTPRKQNQWGMNHTCFTTEGLMSDCVKLIESVNG